MNIVKLQLLKNKLSRAIHGAGNFKLAPWVVKLQINHNDWVKKCDMEKDKLYNNFMNLKLKKRTKTETSTNGLLTIPVTPKRARKPGQIIKQRRVTFKS